MKAQENCNQLRQFIFREVFSTVWIPPMEVQKSFQARDKFYL